ncbi:MAG: pentapeptide repeat-containing protein [Nitrospirae bacterium]|nr:pentapeptide repeat-containing protein [Nitrospirota bacterium]
MKFKRLFYLTGAKSGALRKGTSVVDPKTIKESLDESSSYNRKQLIFFLLLLAYVFTVAAATTDIQLLLTDTRKITLPFLSAEIPILFFYRFTPIIIFLFHINLFINLYLYAREYIPWLEDEKNKPSYLTTLFFNYSFINNNGKLGFSGYFLLTIILYSFLPFVTLAWITLMFLPYRSEGLTLYHEIIIILDALVSAIFFWIINKLLLQKRQPEILLININILIITTLYFIFILCLYPINLFPYQRTEHSWFDNKIFNRNLKVANKTIVEKESRDASINYNLSKGTNREEALANLSERLDLRKRNLSYADFSNSKFINANLDNAILTGALLDNATFQRASLRSANLDNASLRDVLLDNASLQKASLQGADLYGASLQGTDLSWASLQGADLWNAKLQGANLLEASLQGADLSWASLQGASLYVASLQRVSLHEATLQGAFLYWANLQGADLSRANLQGADLSGANLQGADLFAANLQGADLFAANLQGAFLYRANLYCTP